MNDQDALSPDMQEKLIGTLIYSGAATVYKSPDSGEQFLNVAWEEGAKAEDHDTVIIIPQSLVTGINKHIGWLESRVARKGSKRIATL